MLVCSLNNVQTEDYYFIAQTRASESATGGKVFARFLKESLRSCSVWSAADAEHVAF